MSKQSYESAQVRKTSETSVQVTRSFHASRDLVFKAFTTPALIKRWMLGPPGWDMSVCEMDLREGGKFRWNWKNKSDGNEFGFHGAYRQVISPQKIVHTQTYDPGTVGGDMGAECLGIVTFMETAGVTTVITQLGYQNAKDMETALATGMTEGMEMSYKLLAQVLQG